MAHRTNGFSCDRHGITIMFRDETFLDLENVTTFDTTGDLYYFSDGETVTHVNPAHVLYIQIGPEHDEEG